MALSELLSGLASGDEARAHEWADKLAPVENQGDSALAGRFAPASAEQDAAAVRAAMASISFARGLRIR